MSEKIFSGDSSKAFWLAINQSKDKDLLYDYGCKAQEMEASHDALVDFAKFAVAPEAPFSTDQLEFANRIIQAIEEKAKAAIAQAKKT